MLNNKKCKTARKNKYEEDVAAQKPPVKKSNTFAQKHFDALDAYEESQLAKKRNDDLWL